MTAAFFAKQNIPAPPLLSLPTLPWILVITLDDDDELDVDQQVEGNKFETRVEGDEETAGDKDPIDVGEGED